MCGKLQPHINLQLKFFKPALGYEQDKNKYRTVRERKRTSHLHEVVVDQVDDLQVPGQDSAEHVGRPALEGLGQDGVVGVSAAPSSDVPGLPRNIET